MWLSPFVPPFLRWKFTNGVDDAVSECGLDNRDDWDVVLRNEGTELSAQLAEQLDALVARIQKHL
eukprot:m.144582 g.144582  ORF g.144582 m.144582 type:complete len:65 (-) comp17197_c0_seq4:95-289(-)